MKYLLILSLFLINSYSSIGAKHADSIRCRFWPMRECNIKIHNEGKSQAVYVTSLVDSVFSITSGEVQSIFNVKRPDGKPRKCILIKCKNDTILSFTNMTDVCVKKGDVINKGQYMGKSFYEDKEKENRIEVSIYRNNVNVNHPVEISSSMVLLFIKENSI